MAKQTNFDVKEFCSKLLKSETEEEVVEKLKEYGFWDDRSAWKPYGDVQNNRFPIYANNMERMRYAQIRASGFMIGNGTAMVWTRP